MPQADLWKCMGWKWICSEEALLSLYIGMPNSFLLVPVLHLLFWFSNWTVNVDIFACQTVTKFEIIDVSDEKIYWFTKRYTFMIGW